VAVISVWLRNYLAITRKNAGVVAGTVPASVGESAHGIEKFQKPTSGGARQTAAENRPHWRAHRA
jgi:hypothetical protein